MSSCAVLTDKCHWACIGEKWTCSRDTKEEEMGLKGEVKEGSSGRVTCQWHI